MSSLFDFYRRAIRGAVRSLWTGALGSDEFEAKLQFFDAMDAAIRRGLTQSWALGLKDVGIKPGEQTTEERVQLARLIQNETNFIFGFADAIWEGRKGIGKLGIQFVRADGWAQRARDVRNQATMLAKDNPKLEWIFDPRKEHCVSCAKLNGKVKRLSFWKTADVHPQQFPNPKLECTGFNCGCVRHPTDKPLSRGPLPRVP